MTDTMDGSDSSSTSESDAQREEGWEDVEPDDEPVTFVSLFDSKTFSNALDMLHYCKDEYHFDIWTVKRTLALDFIGLIRLVNYIRTEVQSGNQKPPVPTSASLQDDKYLKPVLDDDALLYSLDDVFDEPADESPATEIHDLKEQLADVESQFAAYRDEVQKVLDQRLDDEDKTIRSSAALPGHSSGADPQAAEARAQERYEADYFSSYSYNFIHETMLKDKIRTDAYRDFIYDNKHIFQGKVVLDVGCGTGILSMFCAKAGARKVIAVDNSDVIEKATQNVFVNGLQSQVTCLRGRIEEVTLPVPQVDIIVSEWMGYCLLYESMLDSVIWARNRYLAPDGLMVPSHARLLIAPLAESEIVASYLDFWKDVYGFSMTSMLEKAYDEVVVRVLDKDDMAAAPAMFLELDMHTAEVADLSFCHPFSVEWEDKARPVEGFVIWFDIFFLKARSAGLDVNMTVTEAQQQGTVAFSTGPRSRTTHWQQGILLFNMEKHPEYELKHGDKLSGTISYEKKAGEERSLDIRVQMSNPPLSQSWSLR